MKSQDKYRGCLLGGAAGDALGYAIEFQNIREIKEIYGKDGITEYELKDGKARFSDDTQMTLFTANGLLNGTTQNILNGREESYLNYVHQANKDWYRTQTRRYPLEQGTTFTWLANVSDLFQMRTPGMTCMNAIRSGKMGFMEEPLNNSKGCGGIMRVAAVGLYLPGHMSLAEADQIGAGIAALTHGHPLGYIPAAALVHIISLAAHEEELSLLEIVENMEEAMKEQFAGFGHLKKMLKLVNKAVELSKTDLCDQDAIRKLGEGWVAEETLAIAVYCALKYHNDFDKALQASVNHSGDSDSTGAVTGNILGAYLGLQGIPDKYIENLELSHVIREIADDLYQDCKIRKEEIYADKTWVEKYVHKTYCPN